MDDAKIKMYERALAREKAARKEAERILEDKSRELYFKSEELKVTNKKLESLVKETTTELKGVFENIVDAYVVMNLRGDTLKMNDAAEVLLGYTLADGVNLMDLVHPEERQKVVRGFLTLRKEGAITDFNVKIIIADNSTRLVHINASLIYGEKGRPTAAQGIVRDITEFKLLELQKERLLTDLERSNDELQEYAHVVSHDLKSPLRSINALVSWVKEDNEGALDAVTLDNLQLIETTLEKMEALISDVLNYSSLTRNTKVYKNIPTQQILVDIISLLHIPDHILITVDKNLPVLKGDRARIQQLFQNLISNAIRFCDKEKGLIHVACRDVEGFYEFSVKDNGIGIEKRYHKKIFKIFQSLHTDKESTGIGLSIVKKIVDLYNGDIWLESKEEVGTTFYFTIPKTATDGEA